MNTDRTPLSGGPVAAMTAITGVQTAWLTPVVMAALDAAERLLGLTRR